MNSKKDTDGLESRSYNGLQLKHMTYDEAYEFAGDFGMNAIIVDKSAPFEMQMVRLYRHRGSRYKLRCVDNAGVYYDFDDSYDIYWIGLK